MVRRKIYSLAFVLAMAAPASATDGPTKVSGAEIDRLLATLTDGKATATLPPGERSARIFAMRRTTSGESEVHDMVDDLFIVRSGRATVIVGGKLPDNARQPGGMARRRISGGSEYQIGPGDVLRIPAGLPHHVAIPRGSDFCSLAIKMPKAI